MNIPRLTLCVSAFAAPAFAQNCRFHDIGNIGGTYTSASAITPDGKTFVGAGSTASGRTHAFRWTLAGGIEDIDSPSSPYSFAADVSDDGAVIVGRYQIQPDVTRAFRWTADGGFQNLGTLGGNRSEAWVVSGDGSVIYGFARNAANQPRYFRWTQSTGMQDIGLAPSAYFTVFNDTDATGSVVVGDRAEGAQETHAFLFDQDGLDLIDGLGQISHAEAISADGTTIVGNALLGESRAYSWSPATGLVLLPHLEPGASTVADSVTADGRWAAGVSVVSGRPDVWHLVRWDLQTQAIQDLGVHSNGIYFNVYGVGDEGRVVAVGFSIDGVFRTYRWTITPDINNDLFIDVFDVIEFFDQFDIGGPRADFNNDGFVDFFDVIEFYTAFESGC